MPRPEVTGRQPPSAERVVYTVPEAGRLLGLSRNGSYEAAKRGDIPTIRIGRRLLVPKVPFHRLNRARWPMRFFTIAEVAEIVEVTTRTVRRWIRSGDSCGRTGFGGVVRISEDDLRDFPDRHRNDEE